MNKDNRTSNLTEATKLISDTEVPAHAVIHDNPNLDKEALFLLARSGSHNEKITYGNLKDSIIDNVVFLTGNQLISGEKIFADVCTFESRVNLNEVIDNTLTGDISGNIFVGESGLFEKLGVGLHFTNRETIDEVTGNYPAKSGEFSSTAYGGGIETSTIANFYDFSSESTPDLSTSTKSFSVYQPSGYYNSSLPNSQQNNSDVSLDGHSLTPDEIHHEMGGAWIGYNFEESFNYKGFTIYRSGLNHCAEEIKVVGSNNGTDWTTLHTVSDIEPSDYNDWGAPTTFETGDYVAEKYDKYRVIATKVISGNYWELAHANIVGVKSYTKIRTVDPTHTLHVSGNSLFIGPVTISGNSRLKGDHLVIGDSFFNGNITITGNLYQTGNSTLIGDTSLSGHLSVTGDVNISGNLTVTGDIGLGEKLYHIEDEDTYLQFQDDLVRLKAGNQSEILISESSEDYIAFSTNNQERARIDNNGALIINSTEAIPTSELSLTGDAYLERLYVTGDDGVWTKVKGGSDEVTSYKTRLTKGSDHYIIDFPKTYGIAPVLSLSLENGNHGGPMIPFMVSGVTTQQYGINFGTALPNDNYFVHTTARPSGESSYQKTVTQTFFTDLSAGNDTYFIEFSNSFEVPPIVSCVVETASAVRVPHLVSGISTGGYNIKFNSNIPAGYKIHTHAVR